MSSPVCCVCEKETIGAHYCGTCSKPVHAICGKSDEEGFGSVVLCNNCSSSDHEPATKKTTSWCIRYPSDSHTLKHKTPKAKSRSKEIHHQLSAVKRVLNCCHIDMLVVYGKELIQKQDCIEGHWQIFCIVVIRSSP